MHKMRPRFLCSLPIGLTFGFFLFLLRAVSTQRNISRTYFLDHGDKIVLNGPDNPEAYTVVVWEWKPHSGKEIETLTTLRRRGNYFFKEKAAGESKVDLYREMYVNPYTLDLTIYKTTFKWAGFFTLAQTEPRKQILKQYELFVIKVEASSQHPLLGSDVTFSCTISRLSDTVILHWRPMDSSQQNMSNTDQIRLNNTVYLMVRHVTVEDGKYVCEVQENGNNVHTSNGDFTVDEYLYKERYTLYRSSTDHSELHLVCFFSYHYSTAEWTWTSHRLQKQKKVIASAIWYQPINVNRTYFRNRLMTSVKDFNGNDFNVRIVPILFQDAGLYTCSMETHQLPTINLITVKGCEDSIYFFHQEGNFVLKGPDNPGNGPIVWEWRPHSGQQTTKRLATFHRNDQQWDVQWSDEYIQIPGISKRMRVDWGTLNLRIRKPSFELAGLFTWTQTEPAGKILRQWELFGIKVEADSPRPVMGSDITLSCTISRLPDTVSLHWKLAGSSQQNRRNNTDQICLNNTVYLMVQHIGAGNPNLYKWEVQENDSIVLNGDTNVEVDLGLHSKTYTVYRSVTDHSELDLICEASPELSETKWTWRSQHFQNQEKKNTSSHRSEPIHVNMSYFGNRLETTEGNVTGKNFLVRIVPVQFKDAGVYTCSRGSNKYVNIELITVTVTTEPSGAVTEGRKMTLTCSVSHVTESMRLVWINDEGKVVEEKHLMQTKQEDNSLPMIIAKVDGIRRNWTCGLFHQSTAKVFIPYYLQVNKNYTIIFTIVIIIGSLALLLVIILAVVLCQRKRKPTGLGNQRQKAPRSKRNTEGESHIYGNPDEIQQMEEINETPVPEMSCVAEYMSVSRKTKQEDTEEGIHYGSISFQPKATGGSSDNTLSSNEASGTNLVASKEDEESVIYAQITKTKT